MTTTTARATLATLADELLEAIARLAAADDAAIPGGHEPDVDLACDDVQSAETALDAAMKTAGVRAITRKGCVIVLACDSIDNDLPIITQNITVVAGPITRL
jgi:hypothetical protein